MNILVIAPHSDDEVLGCGGTIARHVDEGDKVFVAIMTNAHVGAPELFEQADVERIRREATECHQYLRVQQTFFYDFPVLQLETYPQYKIANQLAGLIREIGSEIVYIPHRGDLHCDHAAVYNAALVACRPINKCPVKEVYAYETLSETEWGHPFSDDVFIPGCYIDISGYMTTKLEAMKYYKSQLRDYPNPRSIEGIKALATFRGVTISKSFAEAFMVVRIIK